jgi:anti-anti-sigma regulatory factor
MASNFTMRFQRKNRNLHIHLRGDFDGSSAHVLLNALKRKDDDAHKIFVETSGLRIVTPFGRDVLQGNLSELKAKPGKIIFGGRNKASLAPEEG